MQSIRHCTTDHPRGCGEHPICVAFSPSTSGSSPRMRGAQSHFVVVSIDGRIIPADAGSTHYLDPLPHREGDHPRGCGEHSVGTLTTSKSRGSSPRMRGALSQCGCLMADNRIIPADAGSTFSISYLLKIPGDHPRGCGEHSGRCRCHPVNWGSSPRMRGAPGVRRSRVWWWRIIPADAGSTKVSMT